MFVLLVVSKNIVKNQIKKNSRVISVIDVFSVFLFLEIKEDDLVCSKLSLRMLRPPPFYCEC